MSGDNGIYILKTKNPSSKGEFEYRVTVATAIENVHYNREKGEYQEDFVPEEAFLYFEHCPAFTSEAGALAHADTLLEKIDFTEYGICHLEHPKQTFPFFTPEELDDYELRMNKLEKERSEQREKDTEARREAAKIPLEDLMNFEPQMVFGYLVKDGKRIHGQLVGAREPIGVRLTVAHSDVAFLPSDWDKEKK